MWKTQPIAALTPSTRRNTTGLDELAKTNGDALRKAKFFPLINNHERASFTYEYTVTC